MEKGKILMEKWWNLGENGTCGPFQEAIIEVPTREAYVLGNLPRKYGPKYGTVALFQDPEIPLIYGEPWKKNQHFCGKNNGSLCQSLGRVA